MVLPFGEGTLLDACLANALAACERVILVANVRGDELIERYSGHSRITTVINPVAETGLFSSIQCGLRQVERPFVFIAHGDMPSRVSSLRSRASASGGVTGGIC